MAPATTGPHRRSPPRRTSISYECRHGLSLHPDHLRAPGHARGALLYFVPPGETARGLAAADQQRARRAGRDVVVLVDGVLPLERLGRHDQLPAQLLHRRGRGRPAASSTTRPSTGSGAIISPTSPVRAARRLRHPARDVPRPLPRLGPARGGEARRVVQLDRHGWSPHGSHHVRRALAPGRDQGSGLPPRLLGDPSRPEVRSAGSGIINKALVRAVIDRWLRPAAVAEGFAAMTGLVAITAGPRCTSNTPDRRDSEPDGQHLEPLPVHGHVQHVAQRLVLRVRHRPRHGVPRLQPGPARVRPPGAGAGARAGSSTSPPRSSPTAAPTTSSSRSPSAATTTSAPDSTTTRSGSIFGVAAYIKETGDYGILDEPVPFDNDPEQRRPAVRAPEARR